METDTPEQAAPAPSDWEITNATAAESMEEEKPAEESTDQATLSALDEVPRVMEELEKDKTRYDLHVRLIELLQQAGMADYLEDARGNMHQVYPLTEQMWLDWIADAKKTATDAEGDAKVQRLFEEASRDYFSIPIWKSFVDYVLERFDNKWDDEEQVSATRADLKRAVQVTKNHISKSQDIWSSFIQFQLKWLEHIGSPSQEQIEQVMQDYLERLDTLHTDCEDTFSQYSTFVTTWDNANYEKNLVKANKVYSKTKAAVDERDQYELKLVESGYALDMFYQYIEREKIANDKYATNHIQNLYERAAAIYCTDISLWDDYILYLLKCTRATFLVESVSRRAVRNCPWSGALWAHLARSLEARNAEKDEVIAVFDEALTNKTLLASLEDLVCLFRAKCDYMRRRVNWEDPDEADLVDLRVAFEEALVYIDEEFPDSRDPYFRIERSYAFVEYELMGNAENAKSIWERVVQRLGKSVDAWLGYIQFERSRRNYSVCESLFKRAIAKQPDDPERLMQTWLSMEHEIGSLTSMQEALIRINTKTKLLTREWQAAIAAEEAKQEHEKEKAIKEKQKKSQHRARQRQKQKETRTTSPAAAKQPAEPDNQEEAQEKDTRTSTKRRASEISEEDTISESKRLRVDADLDEEASATRSAETARPARRGGRGRGQARGRSLGRGRGRGARLAMPARQKNDDTEGQERAAAEVSVAGPSAPEEAKPKSQDDFRAMLLGKK